jgi:thymidylate kinase
MYLKGKEMQRAELFKNSEENAEWFKENYENLRKKYDEQWIVIENKAVIKSASTFDEVLPFVKKRDPNRVIVEYMQSNPVAMFF